MTVWKMFFTRFIIFFFIMCNFFYCEIVFDTLSYYFLIKRFIHKQNKRAEYRMSSLLPRTQFSGKTFSHENYTRTHIKNTNKTFKPDITKRLYFLNNFTKQPTKNFTNKSKIFHITNQYFEKNFKIYKFVTKNVDISQIFHNRISPKTSHV